MSSKPPHRKKRPTEFKKIFGRGDPTSLQTGQAAGREALRNDLDWDRDSSGAEKSSFSSRGILIFGGIGLLLLLGVGAWALFFSQTPDDQDQSESLSAGPAAGEIEIPNDTLFDLSPMLVARNFTNNPEPAERLKWARNPQEIAGRISEYPEQAQSEIPTSIEKLSLITVKDLTYQSFVASFENGEQRFLCVVGTDEGPRVDWDTYARHGSASWDEILEGKVSEASVRIMPALSDYYNGQFTDREKWQAFALDSPDLEVPVYGYCEKGSELDEELREGIQSGARRAVVEIKRWEFVSSADRQFVITRLRNFGWVGGE